MFVVKGRKQPVVFKKKHVQFSLFHDKTGARQTPECKKKEIFNCMNQKGAERTFQQGTSKYSICYFFLF